MDTRLLLPGLAALVVISAGCATGRSAAEEDVGLERATPGGLAAVALQHLDDHRTDRLTGGLTDMEDQRYVGVSMVLDGGDNLLSVRASDPAYLPGDRGTQQCGPGADETRPDGSRHECRVLDDGTVVDAYWLAASRRTQGRSMALAYVEGPSRSVQVHFDSAARRPELTWSDLQALATDPLLSWETSAATNAEGGHLDIEVEDRVDR